MINIDEEINAYLLKKLESDKHETIIGKYSPSLLPSCLRRQYYDYKHPTAMPVDKLKIFEIGNMVHEKIADILSKSGKVKVNHQERSITLMHPDYDDLIISGRMDNFLILTDGSKNIIIEVKSAKSLQTYERGTFTDQTEPKPEHVMQINFYLFAIPHSIGLLVYVNKNTFETKQFEVKPDKALLIKGLERAKTLHNFLTTNTFPPAEAKLNKETLWQCKYCDRAEDCAKLTMEKVKDVGDKHGKTGLE